VVGMVIFGKGFAGFDFLEGRWWQFMGKISYEFYLTHFSVLYFLARMVLERGWVGTGNYFWWHLGLLAVSGGVSIFLVLAVGKLRQFVAGMSKGVGQVKVGVLR